MAKNREKQRANKRLRKELMLDRRNEYGIIDPTPRSAVRSIIEERKKQCK